VVASDDLRSRRCYFRHLQPLKRGVAWRCCPTIAELCSTTSGRSTCFHLILYFSLDLYFHTLIPPITKAWEAILNFAYLNKKNSSHTKLSTKGDVGLGAASAIPWPTLHVQVMLRTSDLRFKLGDQDGLRAPQK
jgi:hypothetical protein